MGKRPKLALVDVAERRPAALVSPRGALAQFRQSSATPSTRACWPSIPPKAPSNWLARSEPGERVLTRTRCSGRRLDRNSVGAGRRVSGRVDWGGGRATKNKKQ